MKSAPSRPVLQDRGAFGISLSWYRPRYSASLMKIRSAQVACLARGGGLCLDEMLEGVHRDRRVESAIAQEFQPRDLLIRWHGAQVHMPRPEVWFRECVEPGGSRNPQFGSEDPGLVADAADVESGRGVRQDG